MMEAPYFHGPTLDDVMKEVIERILSRGEPIRATKGSTKELSGVLLEIENPRARISRSETRGKPFSCLGELCWYLAGAKDLPFIHYYLPKYEKSADGDLLHGAYGPRLFNWDGEDQMRNIISLLKRKPTSRQAVIQIFDRKDIVGNHKDVACTCTMQFMIRGDALHMITYMRSNDAYFGMPHDIFCFTMLQEIVAADLPVDVGTYKHVVGSLHLYDHQVEAAQRFVNEGWQSTLSPMPNMPPSDPWPAISQLLAAESTMRRGGEYDGRQLDAVDPYWGDLTRLLLVLRYKKDENNEGNQEIRESMSSQVYDPFIDGMLARSQ